MYIGCVHNLKNMYIVRVNIYFPENKIKHKALRFPPQVGNHYHKATLFIVGHIH